MIVEPTNRHPHTYVLADSIRILVVDDDPILCEFACVYLSSPTASVETASNGEDGLHRLRTEAFDFLLVDLDMPGIGGIDVIAALRADRTLSSLPIIVITSNDDIVSIDLAYAAGATSFATKPINWRLLSYQIRFVQRAQAIALASNAA